MLTVTYFAWVREAMGREAETIDLPAGVVTIGELIDWLAARDGVSAAAFADRSRVRAARDGAMASLDLAIGGACEIALFPPVTGG